MGSTVEADFIACAAEKDPLESAAYYEKLANIAALRRHLDEVMTADRLDALCFPHQQVLVSKVDANNQPGRNGCLTSMSGLPSIVVPGGFSDPTETAPIGVPVGVEFIAAPWQEPVLLEIAYSFEQYTKYRRTPIL
jgi:Asp-tRNA(Asn)/Glu-tRNA(Gln) amidotransferase A subunit family amidase